MSETVGSTLEYQDVTEQATKYLEVYNDTATWAAEALDGNMNTSIDVFYDGNDFISVDGRGMRQIFQDAITEADELAKLDSRLAFEKSRRITEQAELHEMFDMANGKLPNTMVVYSEFPKELSGVFETVNLYDTKRRHNMVRIITWQPEEQKMSIVTQTLDKFDEYAIDGIYNEFNQPADHSKSYLGQRRYKNLDPISQAQLATKLRNIYDSHLSQKHGGNWYAGRQEAQSRQNTYDFVLSQHDLVDDFTRRYLCGEVGDSDMYDLAAALDKRYNGIIHYTYASPEAEMSDAGQAARSENKSYSGCGLTLSSGQSAENILDTLGYGNVIKKMNCPFCGVSQYGDPCASHIKCSGCKAEVRDGKVVSEGNSKKKKLIKKLGKKAVKKTLSFWEKLFS